MIDYVWVPVFLAVKALVVRAALRKTHRRKTRIAAVGWGLVAAPVIATAFAALWLLGQHIVSGVDLAALALLGCPADIALVDWFRVLRDPPATTSDIEYDPTLTNW